MSDQLIKQLNSLKTVSPETAWKERTRRVILASSQEQTPQALSWHSYILRPISVLTVMGVFLFVGSVGVVEASKSALPGSLLYQVKLTSEKMQQQMAVSSGKRMELQLAFVSNRLEELNALSQKEHISSQDVKTAIKQYSANIETLHSQLAQAKQFSPSNVVEIATQVQKTKGAFDEALSKTAKKVNLNEDKEILENVKRVQQKTTEIKKQALAAVSQEYTDAKDQQDQATETLTTLIATEIEETQKRVTQMQEQLPETVKAVIDEKEEESEEKYLPSQEGESVSENTKEKLNNLEQQLTEVKSLLEKKDELPVVLTKLEQTQEALKALEVSDEFATIEPLVEDAEVIEEEIDEEREQISDGMIVEEKGEEVVTEDVSVQKTP